MTTDTKTETTRAVATGDLVQLYPGDEGTWSVGDPNNPTRDDALCGTEAAARENAKAISSVRVAAVWHDSECVALYFEGRAFRPC